MSVNKTNTTMSNQSNQSNQSNGNSNANAKANVSSDAMNLDERKELETRLRSILEEAPSDASADLVVRKSNGGYKGLLKIYSRQRKFIGGSAGAKIKDVVNDVFSEVREQIKAWKRDRTDQLAQVD